MMDALKSDGADEQGAEDQMDQVCGMAIDIFGHGAQSLAQDVDC